MHSSQTFINIFNFCLWEAETFNYSGKHSNGKIHVLQAHFWAFYPGDNTKPAILSKKVCSVLIHVGFSGEFWTLPTVLCSPPEPGLCPSAAVFPSLHVPGPSLSRSRCPVFHFLFLPGVHTFFSCFFFSMFPRLDCNREEENEVSKINSNIPGSPVSPAGLVWLRHSVNPEWLRGWIKQIDAFLEFLCLNLGRRGNKSH